MVRNKAGSKAVPVILYLLVFGLGFAVPQLFLADRERLDGVVVLMKPALAKVCRTGIRLPGVPCREMLTSFLNSTDYSSSLTVHFAAQPDLSAALDRLEWNGRSDFEAAQFLSLFHSVTDTRKSAMFDQRKKMSGLLDAVWKEYPDLVFASRCFDCGNQSRYLREKFRSLIRVPDSLVDALLYRPELTQLAVEKGWLEQGRADRVRGLQGELAYVWSEEAASNIAAVYIQNKEFDKLGQLVRRVGSSPLVGHDLAELPEGIVHAAWEANAERGHGEPVLTRYLISTGYRPALRWAVWAESGAVPYFKTRVWGNEYASYRGMLKEFTDFPEVQGKGLEDYYSDNWRDISWQPDTRSWVTDSRREN